MSRRACVSARVSIGVLFATLAGCGGGGSTGGGGTTPPPPSPSFTISLSPASLTVTQGQSQKTQVSVAGQNGFSGSVSVTLTGLPSGVTATPATLSVAPGTPGSLTLAASSSAALAQSSVSFNGAAQGLSAAATLSLTVQAAPVPLPYQGVGGFLTHGFFDTKRQLLFATNSWLNELDVISPADLSVKARVPLPTPWGIDQMADGNTLVVGTKAQEIFTLNEDTYAVTRYPVPVSTVTNGWGWDMVYPNPIAMANGNVILIAQEYYVDSRNILEAGQALVEWNSKSNTFAQLEPAGAQAGLNDWETDSLARSADGKWATFTGGEVLLYSSDSDSVTPVSSVTVVPNGGGFVNSALNPDGSKIALVAPEQVTFVDTSFNILGTVPIPGDFPWYGTAQFSKDGSKLLLFYGGTGGANGVEVIDASAMVNLGFFADTVCSNAPYTSFLGVDGNGRAYLGTQVGVLAADTTATPIAIAAGGNLPGVSCLGTSPNYFPLNASSQVEFLTGGMPSGAKIYLGGNLATLSPDSTNGGYSIDIPASDVAGTASLEEIDPNGAVTVLPSAISYGVVTVSSGATLLPTSGSPAVDLYGSGIADSTNQSPVVTIGGSAAAVLSSVPVADGVPYAARLQDVTVQAPAGTPGASASISISSANGLGTLANAVTYISGTTIVPASGILQLLFDTHRNLLYAMKAHEVDVLNAATVQWQTPLQLPSPVTALSFGYIALSPDGTKMVIAAASENVVVLDPDKPAQAVVVPNPNGYPGVGISGMVAITQSNTALISGALYSVLDLVSLDWTPESQLASPGYLLKASADGSHLYGFLNEGLGGDCAIDPVTFAPQCGGLLEAGGTDLAASPDGSQFAVIDGGGGTAGDLVFFFDSTSNISNTNVYPDLSPPTDGVVLGAAYSPQGKVLVVGLGNSIEFWDTAQGTLRGRLMTPEELQILVFPNPWLPVMALDSAGQTIYAVSASGVTVLKLPTPLDQMPAAQWPLAVPGGKRGTFQGSVPERVAAMKAQRTKVAAARR